MFYIPKVLAGWRLLQCCDAFGIRHYFTSLQYGYGGLFYKAVMPSASGMMLLPMGAGRRVCARVRYIMESDNQVHYCSDPPGISCPVFPDQRVW